MVRRQHHLGLAKIACRVPEFADQADEPFDGVQNLKVLFLGCDVVRPNAQVLELADRVVGRQAFREGLELVELRSPVADFFLAQKRLTPEAKPVCHVSGGCKHTFCELADFLLKRLDRFIRALSCLLRETRRQLQHLEE